MKVEEKRMYHIIYDGDKMKVTTRIKQTLEDINSIVRVNAMLHDMRKQNTSIFSVRTGEAIDEVMKLLEEKRQVFRTELNQLLEEL